VDESTLRAELDMRLTRDEASTLVEEYLDSNLDDRVQTALEGQNFASDSTVEDLGERVANLESLNTCAKDVNDLVSQAEVEDLISNQDLMTESDVQRLIDNQDFVSEDHVQSLIEDALSSADFASPDDVLSDSDVREIADEVVTEALDSYDSEGLKDLERRFDRYAQKLDALVSGTQGIGTDTATLEARVVALEAKLDALSAEATQGLTLLDLLRHAYRIITAR
jgi:hypothetical protein